MSVSAITLPSFSGETAITVKASTETIKFFEESKQNRRLFALADEETMIQGKLKEFYQKFQKGLANRNNFFVNTIAQFTEVKSRPRRKPDYVSIKNGKVSSEYWYTSDGVIRGSNHWGAGIASCDWFLGNQKTSMYGYKQYGKANWSDFIQKTEIVHDSEKAVLSHFENTIGGIPKKHGFMTPIVIGVNDESDLAAVYVQKDELKRQSEQTHYFGKAAVLSSAAKSSIKQERSIDQNKSKNADVAL